MDDSEILKKIISEEISSNYDVDVDDINIKGDEYLRALKKSATVTVGSNDSD